MIFRIRLDDTPADLAKRSAEFHKEFELAGPTAVGQVVYLSEVDARELCLELALQLKLIRDGRIAAAETSEIPRQGSGAFPYPPIH